MRHARDTSWSTSVGGVWSRRAVIGLWVAIFLVGSGALAARWDGLMARLSRPPLASATTGAHP